MTDPETFLRAFTRDRAEVVAERPWGFVARSMHDAASPISRVSSRTSASRALAVAIRL